MKTIGQFKFPEDHIEAEEWMPIFIKRALHRQVLTVAKTRIEGKWCAYIFPVPGKNHDHEWQEWVYEGEKLESKTAQVIFPEFEDVPYAP